MLVVLRDLGLELYIAKDAAPAGFVDPQTPMKDEEAAVKKWHEGNAKARTWIELAVGDMEVVHLSGAETAKEMWDQLCMVKEAKGRIGVLATRRALYRMEADENNFDMVEHVSKLRRLQEELHLMDNKVSNEDFMMILLTLLPESWDMYTSAYLGSSSNKPTLKSHELIAILYEEDRQRKGHTAEATGSSFQAKSFSKGRGKTDSDKECYNCHKKGHMAKDCWSKGGGSEDKGPKGQGSGKGGHQSNQASEATNRILSDALYMANADPDRFSKLDWILDSGTTSHICTACDAFTDYAQLLNVTVQGVGKGQAEVKGRGTVVVKFSVEEKIIQHQLCDVLHIPDAPNCLLSISQLDDSGGHVDFRKGGCRLFDMKNQIIGEGWKVNRLYQLYAVME